MTLYIILIDVNQTEILELKTATNQIKYSMDGFNFTLDTERRKYRKGGKRHDDSVRSTANM